MADEPARFAAGLCQVGTRAGTSHLERLACSSGGTCPACRRLVAATRCLARKLQRHLAQPTTCSWAPSNAKKALVTAGTHLSLPGEQRHASLLRALAAAAGRAERLPPRSMA